MMREMKRKRLWAGVLLWVLLLQLSAGTVGADSGMPHTYGPYNRMNAACCGGVSPLGDSVAVYFSEGSMASASGVLSEGLGGSTGGPAEAAALGSSGGTAETAVLGLSSGAESSSSSTVALVSTGEKDDIIGYLQKGKAVPCVEMTEDQQWYKVIFHGLYGYVKAPEVVYSTKLYNCLTAAGTLKVSKALVNLYLEPSTSGRVHSKYQSPTTLTVTGVDGEWYIVRFGGVMGYMKSDELMFSYSNLPVSMPDRDYVENLMTKLKFEEGQPIYDYLISRGFSPEGAAGIMGNMYAESYLIPQNLENSYEAATGYTDESYTKAINEKRLSVDVFSHDGAGYGLCQWTSVGRKAALYQAAKEQGKPIDDLYFQLDFLYNELFYNYPDLFAVLKSTTDAREAARVFLYTYEVPGLPGDFPSLTREINAEVYFNKYAADKYD
ncbi:MAG: hypothetical protein HUJ69_09965 [Lachnospiraceae bacterium]|nr:hypothetical protein [Lachnospiraceae bacterium]